MENESSWLQRPGWSNQLFMSLLNGRRAVEILCMRMKRWEANPCVCVQFLRGQRVRAWCALWRNLSSHGWTFRDSLPLSSSDSFCFVDRDDLMVRQVWLTTGRGDNPGTDASCQTQSSNEYYMAIQRETIDTILTIVTITALQKGPDFVSSQQMWSNAKDSTFL